MNYKLFLNLKYSNVIKGIAAVCIMLSHYTQEPTSFVGGFKIINYLFPGNLWVAIFFFYSGYGLSYSYAHKENYLSTFIKKKIINTYIPFLIASSSHAILMAIINRNWNFADLILSCVGIKLTYSVLWYVVELLAICLLFYIDKKVLNGKDTFVLWLFIYAVFMMVSLYFDLGTHWYISTSAVILGMFFDKFKKLLFDVFSKRRKSFSYILIIVSFTALYLLKCFISYSQLSFSFIKYTYAVTALNIVLAPLFVLLIMVITSMVEFNNNIAVLIHLGEISYEIYLWHMFIYILLSTFILNYYLLLVISITATLVMSYCLSKSYKGIKLRAFS